MKDGVIADFKVTEKMLNYFIQKAHNRKMLVHPASSSACPPRLRRWKSARLKTPPTVPRPASLPGRAGMVAAIGAGLPITEPGGIWLWTSWRHHGHRRHFALRHRLLALRSHGRQPDGRGHYQLPQSASTTCSSASVPQSTSKSRSAPPSRSTSLIDGDQGRNLIEGVPKTISIDDSEIREALASALPSS